MLNDLDAVLSHARLAHTHTVSTQTNERDETPATRQLARAEMMSTDKTALEAPPDAKRAKRQAQEVRWYFLAPSEDRTPTTVATS